MDYARSLSGGGQLFYAKEFGRQYGWGLNPLMLRCAFCGEPVLFKHGSEKKPHFAHFPDLPSRSLETCILRQQASNSCSGKGFFNLIKGRGQRLQAFEELFLDVFHQGNMGFESMMKTIIKMNDNHLDIEANLLTFFLQEKLLFGLDECIKSSRLFHDEDYPEQACLRELILCEALDYLTVSGAKPTLKRIVLYHLYRMKGNWVGKSPEIERDKFRSQVCESLVRAPWYEYFQELNSQIEILRCLGVHPSMNELRSRIAYKF